MATVVLPAHDRRPPEAATGEGFGRGMAINHSGRTVELRWTEDSADVDVFDATLTAITVDSLG
jgi:hypothetical protein